MNLPRTFLSYAREDNSLKDQVYSHLSAAGCDLWIDQLDIPVGTQWDRAIEEAIEQCEKFVVLLSENSINSDVVLDEINYALEQKKRVIPVKVDGCKIPLRLRRIECFNMHSTSPEAMDHLCTLLNEDIKTNSNSISEPKASFAYHPGQKQLPSIVVLPFESPDESSDSLVFSDGLLTGIVSALSHIQMFFVIAAGTSRTYRGKQVNIADLAQELRVDYVVMGRLVVADKRIRVFCELINTRDNYIIWSEKFDAEIHDIFDVQDIICRSLVHQLSRGLSQFEFKRVTAKRPEDLSAWELYQRAMHYGWTYDWLIDSIGLLEKAIELDETLAEAYALLAARLAYMVWFGELEMVARAANYVKKALELAPDSSICLLSASVVYNVNGNPAAALEQVERSLEINPNMADAWAHNGLYLAILGRNEEALNMLDYAFELSPKDPARYLWHSHKAICFTNLEEYEKSRDACLQSTAIHKSWFWTYMAQAQSHAMLEEREEAIAAWEQAKQLNPMVSVENHKMWLQSSSLPAKQQDKICQQMEKMGCS